MVPVSVIIPAYITQPVGMEYLKQCLDSCVKQTDDVKVWDDGSTVALEPLVRDYPEVTFLGGPRKSKGYARNRLVDKAAYDLIYPLDADDWLKEDALSVLYNAWNGTPLFSDLIMVHGDTHQVWAMPPFDCSIIDQDVTNNVSSVNVLHTKEQHFKAGRWAEGILLFEDWDYNSRLFWLFCGHKVSQPLVYYRQHPGQSTKIVDKAYEAKAKAWITSRVRSFLSTRRLDPMTCCGQRRNGTKTPTPTGAAAVNTMAMSAPSARPANTPVSVGTNLTVEETRQLGRANPGFVWARYVGGRGMGKHDRRGMASRKKYMRVMYGGLYQVRKEDTVTRAQFEAGARHCGFIEAVLAQEPRPASPPPPPAPAPVIEERKPTKKVERQPVVAPDRHPSTVAELGEVARNIANYSIRELRAKIEGMGAEQLAGLLDAERNSDNPRSGAIKLLEKRIAAMT